MNKVDAKLLLIKKINWVERIRSKKKNKEKANEGKWSLKLLVVPIALEKTWMGRSEKNKQ